MSDPRRRRATADPSLRMTRLTDRRRYRDILRELLLGPATLRELAHALERWQLLVHNDLCQLVDDDKVAMVWIQRPDCSIVAAYQLPTLAEQAARAAETAAFERHVQAALNAAAQHITIPGDPS